MFYNINKVKMENERKYIWITTSFEAFHRYENAKNNVKFLRNIHRHIFHVKIYVEVKHLDREIEFITLKRQIENFIEKTYKMKIVGSCEQIANGLINYVKELYGKDRRIITSVSEDNENGATYCWKI